jgi:hypothetical protein
VASANLGSGAVLAILAGLAILLVLGLAMLRNERRSIRYRIGLFLDREVGELKKEEKDARQAGQELEAVRGAEKEGNDERERSTDNERGSGQEEAP